MTDYLRSTALLLGLLNPFLLIIYLIDVVNKLDRPRFAQVLARGGFIAAIVLCLFALLGDFIFSDILQAEFASFQIFGGIVVLLIGIQFVFKGPGGVELLRGESAYLAGAIAMPVLIGPGTVSASIIIGKRHDALSAVVVVLIAVLVSIVIMIALKWLHDYVLPRKEQLVERYIEVAGRLTALYVGTISIDMIMQGLRTWSLKF